MNTRNTAVNLRNQQDGSVRLKPQEFWDGLEGTSTRQEPAGGCGGGRGTGRAVSGAGRRVRSSGRGGGLRGAGGPCGLAPPPRRGGGRAAGGCPRPAPRGGAARGGRGDFGAGRG